MNSSIKERARRYADKHNQLSVVCNAYEEAATEQREIDIEKACEWLEDNLDNFVYYDCLNGIEIDYGGLIREFTEEMGAKNEDRQRRIS